MEPKKEQVRVVNPFSQYGSLVSVRPDLKSRAAGEVFPDALVVEARQDEASVKRGKDSRLFIAQFSALARVMSPKTFHQLLTQDIDPETLIDYAHQSVVRSDSANAEVKAQQPCFKHLADRIEVINYVDDGVAKTRILVKGWTDPIRQALRRAGRPVSEHD